jgi:hypothetical protein
MASMVVTSKLIAKIIHTLHCQRGARADEQRDPWRPHVQSPVAIAVPLTGLRCRRVRCVNGWRFPRSCSDGRTGRDPSLLLLPKARQLGIGGVTS